MKESKLKVYEFCAFCAPSCQTIGTSPVSRTSFIRSNAIIPIPLAFKRNGTFEREELLVYNSVRFIVLNKSLGEGIGSVCGTRFFTKKVSVIMVPEGRNKAEILNGLYSYIVSANKICKGEKTARVVINWATLMIPFRN